MFRYISNRIYANRIQPLTYGTIYARFALRQ